MMVVLAFLQLTLFYTKYEIPTVGRETNHSLSTNIKDINLMYYITG